MTGKFGWANENGVTCNFICTGNVNEKCGGLNANYIYYLPLTQCKFSTSFKIFNLKLSF